MRRSGPAGLAAQPRPLPALRARSQTVDEEEEAVPRQGPRAQEVAEGELQGDPSDSKMLLPVMCSLLEWATFL